MANGVETRDRVGRRNETPHVPHPKADSSLLVLALASSGDALFLVEPLAARRAARPHERITVAAPPGACDVLRALNLAWASWPASPPAASAGIAAYRTGALFLRAARGRFDDVVDVFPHVRSTIAARIANVSRRTERGGTRFFEALLRLQAKLDVSEPLVERMARSLGVANMSVSPRFQIDPMSDAWVERSLTATGYQGGEPVVVVHGVGAWPSARFVEVADGLRSHFESRLVVLDMPRERGPAKAIAGALGGRVLGVIAPPALRFLAAIGRASAVISDDPGTANLAGVLGVPSVLVTATGRPVPHSRLGCDTLIGATVEDVTASEAYEHACRLVRRERTGRLFER
jgi:ADP-heptose:LPS heptosyltransferase